MTETLANRRVFRSKVDAIRPTYGFEDVSLGPGHRHGGPRRRGPRAGRSAASALDIPVLAAAMDAVADVRLSGELARLGGLSVLNLEGVQFRYDDPAEVLDRIIAAPDDRDPGRARRGLRRPDPRGADRPPHRGAPRRGLQGRLLGHARRRPALRRALRGAGADLFLVQSQVSLRPPRRRRATARSRSTSSRAACRSRSRSATRPTRRRRSR